MNGTSAEDFPAWAHYTFAFLYMIAVVIAILVNGMAVYVFIKKRQLRNSTNVFVMCLCLTDLLMAGMAGPMVVVSSFRNKWLFHDGGCSYYSFIVCLMSYTNIGLVMAIAIDRYVVIVRGSKLTLNVARWVVIGCVIHSFLWSVAPILGWSSYALEGMQTSCSINWQSKEAGDVSFSIALLVELWFLPLVIISYCYVKILNKFRVHKNTVRQLNCFRPQNTQMEITKTMTIIIGAFVLAWTPYSIVCAWAAIGDHRDMHVILVTLPHLSVKFSMVYNPIIYLNRNREFQKSFLKEFPAFNNILCLRNKVAPAVNNTNRFELTTTARLQPREPTISGEKNFCIFQQQQQQSRGSASVSELFQKVKTPYTIPEVDEVKPSTSKEDPLPPMNLRESSSISYIEMDIVYREKFFK